MTRLLYYFAIFGHSQQRNLAEDHEKSAKVGLKDSQILNKLSKINQRFLKFHQNDKISPNLVTLVCW